MNCVRLANGKGEKEGWQACERFPAIHHDKAHTHTHSLSPALYSHVHYMENELAVCFCTFSTKCPLSKVAP